MNKIITEVTEKTVGKVNRPEIITYNFYLLKFHELGVFQRNKGHLIFENWLEKNNIIWEVSVRTTEKV